MGMRGGRIFFYDASKTGGAALEKLLICPAGEPGGPDSRSVYEFDFIPHDQNGANTAIRTVIAAGLRKSRQQCVHGIPAPNTALKKLPAQNVDFGAGLERIATAQLNSPDMFKISVIWPIIEKLEAISGKTFDSHTESMRVIADHLRAPPPSWRSTMSDTSNKNRATSCAVCCVRRAIRFAFELGIEQNFLEAVVR